MLNDPAEMTPSQRRREIATILASRTIENQAQTTNLTAQNSIME